jgi:hypothetical protein
MTVVVMKQSTKNTRYVLELMGALLLYGMVLTVALRFAPGVRSSGLKILVWLSPMLPIGLAIWAIVRHFRRIDEYLRQITLENVSIAAAVTAGAALTYGFLENAGFPKLTMFVVWPVMGAVWGALACVRQLRNR